jgi:hypothetical protein
MFKTPIPQARATNSMEQSHTSEVNSCSGKGVVPLLY